MLPLDHQLAIIRRGVEQIVPEAELRQKLERSIKTGKPLWVKYGIDPTGIDVHLGHTVPLRKLRQFQELGHHAVLIIGNYTALVGDPSGRDQTRARLTQEQVEANARDYLKQVSKVIDMSLMPLWDPFVGQRGKQKANSGWRNALTGKLVYKEPKDPQKQVERTEVHYNGEWFSKFRFLRVLQLTSKITMQRMLERDDFTKRIKKEEPIYLHECLYPLMQGQDSVEIRADVELGGSEQLFSLMVGRDLQRDAGQEPQVAITLPILRGLDGVRRMGKSLGNYIGVGEPALEQFGKTMRIPDNLMEEWFQLLTDRPMEEVRPLIAERPMEAKKLLGREIVSFYHGAQVASAAQTEWEKQFSQRQDPTEIPDKELPASELVNGKMVVSKLLTRLGLTASNGEARRLIQQGGVTLGPDRTRVADPFVELEVTDGLILRVGNRKVVRVRVQSEPEA